MQKSGLCITSTPRVQHQSRLALGSLQKPNWDSDHQPSQLEQSVNGGVLRTAFSKIGVIAPASG